jgi:hypothetical protein
MTKRFIIIFSVLSIWFAIVSSCTLVRLNKFKNSLGKSTIVSADFPVCFKFTFSEWIFLKAKLNNSSIVQDFFLDTGSPYTYCFKTKKSAILKSKKLLRFGDFRFDYGASNAEIASIKYSNLAYLVSDMAHCWKKNNSGYIGVNAMQNSIWEFNFQDTTIKVSDTLSDFQNVTGAYKVKFKPLGKQQTPVVKIVINNNDTITAFIDTGCDKFLQLNSRFGKKSSKLFCPDCVRTSYKNINQMGEHMRRDSIVETNFIKTNSFKIGDLELTTAIINQSPLYKGKNLIGLGFLKNFIVTIDWKHYFIYLKPFSNKQVVTKRTTYGFKCDQIDKVLKVTEILRNDIADNEGIKCGDEILKINNIAALDIDQNTIDSINDELPTDTEIVVQFKTKEVRFKKHDFFN